MNHNELPTQKRLKELFDYDPPTGKLSIKERRRGVKQGQEAGCVHQHGYRIVKIDRTPYRAHRIIWKWMTGDDPKDYQIDHIDLDRSNNTWDNLRLATNQENRFNCPLRVDSTTGLKGVCWDKRARRFRSSIRLDGRLIYLGNFITDTEAHAAYCKAAAELHGQYARTH
jgi:hypothetical protein